MEFGKSETLPTILAKSAKHWTDDTLLDIEHNFLIQGVRFGPSKEDNSILLSMTNIPIPGPVLNILRQKLLPPTVAAKPNIPDACIGRRV